MNWDWLWSWLMFILVTGAVIYTFLLLLEQHSLSDWGDPWRNRLSGLNRLLCQLLHGLGDARLSLPEQGAALIASNHISGLDPLLLIAASPRPLHFMIAREEYERFGFTWLFRYARCIPVDRSNNPQRAFREALRQLEQGHVIALFPHGGIHLDRDPPKPLKAGVARLAKLADCPVLPTRIEGVAGEGHTVSAVLYPSRVRIKSFPLIDCMERERRECLQKIEAAIGPGNEV